MNYEQMRQMEKTHICAECGGALVTFWDSELSIHGLACGTDRTHKGYQQKLTAAQSLARGTANKELGPGEQRILEAQAQSGVKPLSQLPGTDLATNRPLDPDQVSALIAWGGSIGLRPHLGHVCLYFGKPYISIDGYYYLNFKRKKPYVVGTRPANDVERTTYQVNEGDHFYIAEAWLERNKLETVGLGVVTKEEIEGKSTKTPEQFRAPVVHNHPQRMAEKRAEWQLLRKLIPLEEQ